MSWLSVRARAEGQQARDAIAAALIGAGAQGVQEDGDWILTYLPDDTDRDALRRSVTAASASALFECAPASELEYGKEWLPQIGVQRVGAIAVAPPWLAAEAGTTSHTIIIDPAMAFGTGEHATTRGALLLMQDVVRPGDTVADLGTGSAVLSIAAAMLGAARVAAIDVDPDATGNAELNVERNRVADRVTVLTGEAHLLLPLVAPVRVILANIISSVLLELSSLMRDALAPGGVAVVSGVLVSEREDFVRSLAADGWRVHRECAEDEWWSAVLAPR
ncbi:MAG: 50S ribosomal protein L11 methyltransferase [Gemmatimonadaceae bacterium]